MDRGQLDWSPHLLLVSLPSLLLLLVFPHPLGSFQSSLLLLLVKVTIFHFVGHVTFLTVVIFPTMFHP